MILFRPEHVTPILEGRKTQTRRLGARRWNEGAIHQARTRMLDSASTFARLRILRVRRQQLRMMAPHEARAEGYSSVLQFREAFFRINRGLDADPMVWVIEFELVGPEMVPVPPGWVPP